MVSFRYPRSRVLLAIGGEDALLVAALLLLAWVRPHAELAAALFVGIPLVLLFSVVTLHYPSRVDIDEQGISFGRYGRVHRFEWGAIDRVHVRRFLTGDRVLVRITPSSAIRGRYWILGSMEGFTELVRALEARASP